MKNKHDQQIERVSIESLIPYARNSRTHSDAQVAQIAASIREFGFTNPVLIDKDGGIIAGHGRVMGARKLGLAEVPCIRLDHLTETQKRAYIIADNKLALNAGWDEELLAVEFSELADAGFDLGLTGFTDEEIAALGVDDGEEAAVSAPIGSLSDRFMIPPFSVLNAREGWWQNRKRQWLALGIKSELGRGGGRNSATSANSDTEQGWDIELRRNIRAERKIQQAAPGGSARPACDYSKKQRGDGAGRPIA